MWLQKLLTYWARNLAFLNLFLYLKNQDHVSTDHTGLLLEENGITAAALANSTHNIGMRSGPRIF